MRKLSVFFLYCSPLLAIFEPTARSLRVHYYLYNLRNQRQFVDPINVSPRHIYQPCVNNRSVYYSCIILVNNMLCEYNFSQY